MRDDIDALAVSFLLDVMAQFGRTLFYRRGWGDGGEDDFYVVGFESFGDAAPVVDTWEELAD